MKIPMYQVDAFTGKAFGGNPAAVCVLADWLDDGVLQNIAAENNLSETAFLIPKKDHYLLRWFTPKAEIALAGHPTLASAFVVFELLRPGLKEVRFETQKSGSLSVSKDGPLLTMDFPSQPAQPHEAPRELIQGLGLEPQEVLKARDYLAVLASQEELEALEPSHAHFMELDSLGVIATAPGREVDFVSRFFAPKHGIPEDPVTGSAHCTLIPYWSKRLSKTELTARQVSARGGELFCRDKGQRVSMAGEAVLFLEGYITL